ncbi:hypothetical protein ACYOEI_09045 [Singulisphaera rosea]
MSEAEALGRSTREPMPVDGLVIPDLLPVMLYESRWPRDAIKDLSLVVPEDRRRRFRRICLYPHPFETVAKCVAAGDRFYTEFGARHELVPEAAVPIADFGLGADAPILLDFRAGPADPVVIALEWPDGDEPNYWKVMAPDFAGFVELLGL